MSDKRKSRQSPHGKNAPEMKSSEEKAPGEKGAEKKAHEEKVPMNKEGNFGASGPGKMGIRKSEELKVDDESSSDEDEIEQPKDLPPFWKAYKHESGVVVYMHKPSRICSLSKPFYIPLDDSALEDISLPDESSYMASASSAEVKKEDSMEIDKNKKAK